MQTVQGPPFGVAASARGGWSFVSLANQVEMFRSGRSVLPSPAGKIPVAARPLGEALTRDGRYLLVAGGRGAMVIGVRRAEQGGTSRAVLGTLASQAGAGSIEVAVSPDGRFAFVSLEDSGRIAVFNLRRALTSGFGPRDFVGTVPVGTAPVGLAVSPGGRWLYATSEVAAGGSGEGTLTTISLRRAESDPARSAVSAVSAGCGAVRVITSASGRVVWVTARESDALLGFSAAALVSRPARSLIARVAVGEAPVGLALVDGEKRMIVADSDRFGARGASSSLAVVDVAAALAGRPALRGYLRAGGFPREMALESGGKTLLVTNFASDQLEAVNVTGLP